LPLLPPQRASARRFVSEDPETLRLGLLRALVPERDCDQPQRTHMHSNNLLYAVFFDALMLYLSENIVARRS
jgi:hypothetical protein